MAPETDQVCVEHDWVPKTMHLSLDRGVELEEHCSRCGAVAYIADTMRNRPNRSKLTPTRRLPGE